MEASQSFLIEHWGLPNGSEAMLSVEQSGQLNVNFKIFLFSKPGNCRVFWTPRGRFVQYADGSQVLVQHKSNSISFLIFTTNHDRWLELGKLCYLSAFGLQEELKGKMRLHTAAINHQTFTNCYWGLPNAGKTTLAMRYLNQQASKVLSDELCFFDGKKILGVPLKLHDKDQKKLVSNDSLYSESLPLNSFYVLKKSIDGKLYCRQVSLFQKLFLFLFLVSGVGLHQMAEYHLSAINFFNWLKILTIRIRLAWILLTKYPIMEISLPKNI